MTVTATPALPAPARSPLDGEDVRARVESALQAFLHRQRALLEEVSGALLPMMDVATGFLAGGKRLRPVFCYWGWRGAGGADGPEIVQAAASLELFQAAALLHDDVMDDSDTRRGQPAAHRRFAALHRSEGRCGSSEQFGTAGAILLGDLCLAWSDEMLTASGLPAAALAAARSVFDPMRTELMAGQYLDMLEQGRPLDDTSGGGAVARALRVVRYKSAKYSIEHPLLLGGRLAGADPATLAAYSAYGLPLGEAFQLRDDILGVFGDPETTGKPAGDDLREGKRTVLVALALEAASPAQAEALRRHLGDPQLSESGVALLRQVLEETGARTRTEALIAQRTALAAAALEGAPVEPVAVSVLQALIAAATDRAL